MAFHGDCAVNSNNFNFDVIKNYFRTGSYGNFFALVKLMAGENHDLGEHLRRCQDSGSSRTSGHKLTFLSNTFVNKALLLIRQTLVKEIVQEIHRNGGSFGLEMDGTQDVAFQEQLSIVVRYIDNKTEVAERTVLFVKVQDTSGKGIFDLLENSFAEIGLEFKNLIGYSFDGAANMRSTLNAQIQEINEKCLYTWCFSHRFNLVMKTAISHSSLVDSILQLAENTARIFRGSHIRMDVWIDVVKSVPNYNSQKRLKLIGTTRWNSKQDAIHSVIDEETNLYVVIKALLGVLRLSTLEGDALITVDHILNEWLNYENVVSTYILHEIFDLVMPTTKFLQHYGLNTVEAYESVKSTQRKLNNFEKSIDECFRKAELFIEKTNALMKKDQQIAALNTACEICLSKKSSKQKVTERIKKHFLTFIQALQTESEKRILNEFDTADGVHEEMLNLNPLRANKLFSNHEYVKLHDLCEKTNSMSGIN